MMSAIPRSKISDSSRERKSQISDSKEVSYEPVKWDEYFNIRDDIELEVGTFRIYRRGVEGPLLFFIHGGGFSALTWAVLSALITEQVKCQCLAVDMRGHGDTNCQNDDDMSVDTLSRDVIKIIFAMYPTEAPPIILVGHSMGGAVAIHVACKRTIPSLAGLVVIDVVEGSALSCLKGMTAFLRSRPQSFRSLSHAIEWSIRSLQIRNINSARVSFPGQLKRITTGQTATSELDQGVALISDTIQSTSIISTTENRTSAASRISTQPIAESPEDECHDENTSEQNGTTESKRELQTNLSSEKESPKNVLDGALPDTTVKVNSHPKNSVNLSSTEPHSHSSNSFHLSHASNGQYTWRIDLMKTQPFWQEWFSGLSNLFLSIPEPKLLLLADVDRLDKDLTIGQMQGKFQVRVFPRTGHAVQEDAPAKVAECLARFLVRNRFTEARSNCEQ